MSKRIAVEDGQIFGLNNIFKMPGIDLADLSKTRPWTPDGREHLIELYLQGWTVEEIAAEMNRTPGSVVGELYDLGEAEKIHFAMWGSKNGGGQQAAGQFSLFAAKGEKNED